MGQGDSKMGARLDCVMLVDDSMSDNFLHERMIQRLGCVGHVATMRTGHGAIDYLTSYDKKSCLPPQLILLDVEMPGMDGWQFVEAYQSLHESDKTAQIIMMVASDKCPEIDLVKANPAIKDYVVKPMTDETLQGLMQTHFPG